MCSIKYVTMQLFRRNFWKLVQQKRATTTTIEQTDHLTIFCGVKLDSHKWFITAPFQVLLNWVSHSDLCSDSDENPADPTKIKCWMCSGCYNSNTIGINNGNNSPWEHNAFPQINIEKGETITLSAYLAATYPPKECPSKIKLLRFLALRHSSKESINHASVSALQITAQLNMLPNWFFLEYNRGCQHLKFR